MKKAVLFIVISCCGSLFCQDTLREDQELTKAALSFYQWYISSLHIEGATTDFKVVPDNKGKCRLDTTDYFAELRNLGTISEDFIKSEIKRTKECALFLSKLSWQSYKSRSDASVYENQCPFFTNNYWIQSRDIPEGVELKSILQVEDKAEAVVRFFSREENEKNYRSDLNAKILLEKNDNVWEIESIILEKTSHP